MNRLNFFFLVVLLAAHGCQSPKVDQSEKNMNDSASRPANVSSPQPGSDRDAHGCIPSAGYTWSEIKKECVRIWEAGNKFTAYGENKDSTLAAYLITGVDQLSAEVFLPGQKGSIPLAVTDGSLDKKSMQQLFLNLDSSVILKFFPSQARYVIFIDKKPMYACPHPLK